MPDTYWLFVIDTDSYAGNFQRELTAFCTGHVGERVSVNMTRGALQA